MSTVAQQSQTATGLPGTAGCQPHCKPQPWLSCEPWPLPWYREL